MADEKKIPVWSAHVPGYTSIPGVAGTLKVQAYTKSEARAMLKEKLHFKGRLPIGTVLTREKA